MEMKKVEVKMNKPIYLGQAILDISKTLMYEFWYDYIKSKYKEKARLCYMDTNSFVIYIKTEDGLIHLIMMKRIKDLFQFVKIKR